MIVRLYECHGARGTARLTSSLGIKTAERVNLLEEPMAAVSWTDSVHPRSDLLACQPPYTPAGRDWVLLLDDETRGYPSP